MKQKIFSICFLMAASYLAKSQTIPTPQKVVRPKIFTLKLKTEKKLTYGYLSGINDSLLQLSAKWVTFSNHLVENSGYKTYTYAEVEKVNIRRHGSVGRGIGYGALIGMAGGALIGLVTYEPDPNAFLDLGSGINAIAGACIGVIPGMIIGGIIGSKMRKFIIHRNKEKFNEMKTSILEMALNKNEHVIRDSLNTK